MTTPVNLNRIRKEKARADKRDRAGANAAKFGRTKAQKAAEETDRTREEKTLDQHRRETE